MAKKIHPDDFSDLTTILESFVSRMSGLSEKELIDLGARCKPVAKAAKTIDDFVKARVKDKLGEHDGVINGNIFRANMKMTPFSRLDQAAFKKDLPAIHAEYTDTGLEPRITYEVR